MQSSRLDLEYKDLDQVIRLIRAKIKESIPFARKTVPNYIHTAPDLFDWLKKKLVYIPDPKGIELLQSMQSLFLDNYHGIKGGGDCDCFVVTGAACLEAMGIDYKIVLSGNGKSPTHVFLMVGPDCFDLTRPEYGICPKYKRYWNA